MNTSILRIPQLPSSTNIHHRSRRPTRHQEAIRAYRRALRAAEQAAWEVAEPDPAQTAVEPASNVSRFLLGMLIATATAAMVHRVFSHPDIVMAISRWIG
jgi:hypothetical protein